jgi:hypothetical protein
MSRSLCQRLEESLAELAELRDGGELEAADRQALLAHAEACSACADSLRGYQRTIALLRSLPAREVPDDFLCWVRARVDGSGKIAEPRRRRLPLWLGLAASLCLALGAALFWSRREPRAPRADTPAVASTRGSLEELQAMKLGREAVRDGAGRPPAAPREEAAPLAELAEDLERTVRGARGLAPEAAATRAEGGLGADLEGASGPRVQKVFDAVENGVRKVRFVVRHAAGSATDLAALERTLAERFPLRGSEPRASREGSLRLAVAPELLDVLAGELARLAAPAPPAPGRPAKPPDEGVWSVLRAAPEASRRARADRQEKAETPVEVEVLFIPETPR